MESNSKVVKKKRIEKSKTDSDCPHPQHLQRSGKDSFSLSLNSKYFLPFLMLGQGEIAKQTKHINTNLCGLNEPLEGKSFHLKIASEKLNYHQRSLNLTFSISLTLSHRQTGYLHLK